MVDANDLKDFSADIAKRLAKSASELLNDKNGIMIPLGVTAGTLLGYKLLKHNAVPLITFAVCATCNFYIIPATYKAIKAVIEDPFKGLFD